ncbi:MAG: hypothetical protein V3S01_04280 [Dehalococcoidia bacterium]
MLGVAVLAACGGSGDEDSSEASPTAPTAPTPVSLTTDEIAYLGQVRAAYRLTEANFAKFGRILGQSFATSDAMLGALSEAGAGTTFSPTLDALEEIEPAERFRVDHNLLLEKIEAAVAGDLAIAEAGENRDIVAFTVGNKELSLVFGTLAFETSSAFCLGLDINPPNLCEPGDDLPGGEYGSNLNTIMRDFEFNWGPRVGSLIDTANPDQFGAVSYAPLISAEEYDRLFALIAPEVEDVLVSARESIEALEPGDEFAADHDRLLLYFDGLANSFGAVYQAVEDDDRVSRLRSIEGQLANWCSARQDFLDSGTDFMAIVGVHFPGPPPGDSPAPPPGAPPDPCGA